MLHHSPRRFIKNNLIVEITSSARLARMFGWLLKRHTMLSFYLYTAGFVRWGGYWKYEMEGGCECLECFGGSPVAGDLRCCCLLAMLSNL